MTNLILVIHLERKVAARIQDRRGPMLSLMSFRELGEDLVGDSPSWRFKQNYAGIGILQNLADTLENENNEIKLTSDLINKALVPLKRMMNFKLSEI